MNPPTPQSDYMNKEQAHRLTVGLRAIDRQIRVNRDAKCFEIHEGNYGESHVVKTYPIAANTEPGWRERNIETLKQLHADTDGGRGRTIDTATEKGWAALGLPDNSTKVDLAGEAV